MRGKEAIWKTFVEDLLSIANAVYSLMKSCQHLEMSSVEEIVRWTKECSLDVSKKESTTVITAAFEVLERSLENTLKWPSESLEHNVVVLKRARTGYTRYLSLFEWSDGPLVTAMREGDVFVLDEINLAEDGKTVFIANKILLLIIGNAIAVIERLNSVLESGRTLTLLEAEGGEESQRIVAHPNFRFVATMNPG